VEVKQAQDVLDYDDLLLYWAQMMKIAEVAQLVSRRFDHVLVDEYQDTNALQASILLALRPDGVGLTVVGDDGSNFSISQTQPMLTSTTGSLRAQRFLPSKLSDSSRT